MSKLDGLDIVTRLYDLADLPLLDLLVFSIMGQGEALPVRLHVMLQRFSFDQAQVVRRATSRLRALDERVSVSLHNWDNPAPRDLRVPLLNWGLHLGQNRYFTCLDVHEQLYPHACMALLQRLRDTEAAMALGGAAFQPVWWWGDVVLPVPDPPETSTATPVFMIDRDRLPLKECVFRSGETESEIEEFIERLGTQFQVDTTRQGDTLAVRMGPI